VKQIIRNHSEIGNEKPIRNIDWSRKAKEFGRDKSHGGGFV
jgi:hypothetical protein